MKFFTSLQNFIKKITIFHLILFLAALYTSYNYGLAGGVVEEKNYSIGGFILGLIVNFSLAIASAKYGSVTGEKRTKQALYSFGGLIVLSIFLISPAIFYSLPKDFLNPILRGFWAFAWAAAPDIAIILCGAVIGKNFFSVDPGAEKPKSEKTTDGKGGAPQSKKRTPPEVRTEAEEVAKRFACKIAECKWSPPVDDLIKVKMSGGNMIASANSKHGNHVRYEHYHKVVDTKEKEVVKK
ncbi:MAG TPA: hypothetical protein DIW23_05685 [Anaerolineae bacterium]|nr:hypothetical protein [Anaerolineae bacterium]